MNASQIPRENLQLALLKDRRERILYTYKAHEKAADRADWIHCCRRVASILLTSVSVTTFATSLSGIIASQESASLMISFIALLATVVSLVSDYFNFDAESREHVRVASRLRFEKKRCLGSERGRNFRERSSAHGEKELQACNACA